MMAERAFKRLISLAQAYRTLCLLLLALLITLPLGLGLFSDYSASKIPVLPPDADDSFLCMMANVGQGDCFILQSHGQTALIDCGDTAHYEQVRQVLTSLGVHRIDSLILTHFHDDHCGNAARLMDDYPVDKLYANIPEQISLLTEEILLSAERNDVPLLTCAGGQELALGDIRLIVLAPVGKIKENNDSSIVLKAITSSGSILFAGDIEQYTENELLKQPEPLKADILKIAHHGSHTSTGEDFLRAVSPTYALISAGEENELGHPSQWILERLKKQQVPLLRTDRNGCVLIYIKDGAFQLIPQKK